MNMPPMIMRMKIRKTDSDFRLWLPLFIIIPLLAIFVLALSLVVLPFLLLAAIFRWRLWRTIVLFWPSVLVTFAALRGLEIDVNGPGDKVFLSFK